MEFQLNVYDTVVYQITRQAARLSWGLVTLEQCDVSAGPHGSSTARAPAPPALCLT